MLRLKQHCDKMKATGQKALVYYFHAKGACCWKDYKGIYHPTDTDFHEKDGVRFYKRKYLPSADWRDEMNAGVLEFPSTCLRAILEKNYSSCGMENQLAHYSGNFWWADCDHVAQLDLPPNRFDWRKPEFFILYVTHKRDLREKFGYYCGYSIFNCNINLYGHECPRSRYFPFLWQNIWNDTSIGKSMAMKGSLIDGDRSLCKEMRRNSQTYASLGPELVHNFRDLAIHH